MLGPGNARPQMIFPDENCMSIRQKSTTENDALFLVVLAPQP